MNRRSTELTPTPTLRFLHLPSATDLDREATRGRVSAPALAALRDVVGEPSPDRDTDLFALTDLGRHEAEVLDRHGRAAGVSLLLSEPDEDPPSSLAPGGSPPVGGKTTAYLAGSRSAVLKLLSSLGAVAPRLASATGLLDGRLAERLAGSRPTRPFGARPLVMGVLNVTPDSFSDGGAFASVEAAVRRAWQMAEEGADIVDIGGESTRPGAGPVSESTELDRVLPVLARLGPEFPLPISIDTWKSGVAGAAIAAGVEIVNDVTGTRGDPRIADVAAAANVTLVISHIRGTPRTMQLKPRYRDLMAEVVSDLHECVRVARHAGVAQDRIVLDPGIGFGKSFEDNIEILRRLPEIARLSFPVLVGVSRKSFLGRILDRPPHERLEGSLAAGEIARAGGASLLRVHDVAETCRFLETMGAVLGWPHFPREGPR